VTGAGSHTLDVAIDDIVVGQLTTDNTGSSSLLSNNPTGCDLAVGLSNNLSTGRLSRSA
jgi:hypothetical protein